MNQVLQNKKTKQMESRVLNLFSGLKPSVENEMKFHISNKFSIKRHPKMRNLAETFLKTKSWRGTLAQITKERKTSKAGFPTVKSQITTVIQELEVIKQLNSTIAKNIKVIPDVKKQDYTQRIGKECTRIPILDKIKESADKFGLKDGLILTLSSWQCLMEQKINSEFPKFEFLTCENDLKNLEKLFFEKKDKNFKFIKLILSGDIGNVIKLSKKDAFSHLLLDYCGTFVTYKNEIQQVLQNDITKKGGIISITLATRVGVKGFNTTKELTALVNKYGKGRYKILHTEPYKDTMDMLTMIIRRVK